MLNQAQYLYLNCISEPRDNSVRIVVDEATDRPAPESMKSAGDGVSKNVTSFGAIRSTGKCKRFELLWDLYVAYLVREEAAGSMGRYDDEVSEGGLFRVFTKSHFLDHISRDTGGHTRPVLHFRIACLNHLIDVASCDPPKLKLLGTIAEIGRF
jgi:hypothetical protein